MSATFQRLSPEEVRRRLASAPPPLTLDVRREDAFAKDPRGIAGAVPLFLDRVPIRVPDASRDQPIIAYCL